MGLKRLFLIQKKKIDGSWISVSQCYCKHGDVRTMIHAVSFDENTRIIFCPPGILTGFIPLYNFCPPGVMTLT